MQVIMSLDIHMWTMYIYIYINDQQSKINYFEEI